MYIYKDLCIFVFPGKNSDSDFCGPIICSIPLLNLRNNYLMLDPLFGFNGNDHAYVYVCSVIIIVFI